MLRDRGVLLRAGLVCRLKARGQPRDGRMSRPGEGIAGGMTAAGPAGRPAERRASRSSTTMFGSRCLSSAVLTAGCAIRCGRGGASRTSAGDQITGAYEADGVASAGVAGWTDLARPSPRWRSISRHSGRRPARLVVRKCTTPAATSTGPRPTPATAAPPSRPPTEMPAQVRACPIPRTLPTISGGSRSYVTAPMGEKGAPALGVLAFLRLHGVYPSRRNSCCST